jgi:hypothetical protein
LFLFQIWHTRILNDQPYELPSGDLVNQPETFLRQNLSHNRSGFSHDIRLARIAYVEVDFTEIGCLVFCSRCRSPWLRVYLCGGRLTVQHTTGYFRQ